MSEVIFLDFFKAKGLVVGETAINEGDKMLTVYTDEYGLINAKAPGAKSLRRKDMAGINMFAYGDYILTRNKNIYTVRECNIITHFFDIKKDISSLSVGCYILEAVKATGVQEMPDEEKLYDLAGTPEKRLVWFEHGRHSMLRITDTERYDTAVKEFVGQFDTALHI